MGNSCSNSSNLYGNVNITTVSASEGAAGAAGGARLVMTIPLSGISGGLESGEYTVTGTKAYPFQIGGVTAGDVLRYNAIAYNASTEPTGGKYVKANANSAGTSEVVGVVEDINVADQIANIVIYGQVKYPTHRLYDSEHIDAAAGANGSAGGNDIYFLSGTTAGYLQNLAPSTPTYVAKPVLQMAADPNAPDFNAIVANYIGYQIGGEIIASNDSGDDGAFTETLVNFGDDVTNDPCRHVANGQILPVDISYSQGYHNIDGRTYLNAYNRLSTNKSVYGYVHRVVLTSAVTDNQASGKRVSQLKSSGTTQFKGTSMYRASSHETDNTKIVYVKSNDSQLNSNLLYVGDVGFTIASSSVVGFFLPKIGTNSFVTVTDPLTSKTYKQEKQTIITQCPDQGKTAVSIPQKVTIDELTINTALKAGNTSVEIADVADTINTMKTEINTLKKQVEGDGFTDSLSSKFTSK